MVEKKQRQVGKVPNPANRPSSPKPLAPATQWSQVPETPPNDQRPAVPPKKKTPWWVWLLIVFGVLAFLGFSVDDGEDSDDAATSTATNCYGDACITVTQAEYSDGCFADGGNICVALTVFILNGGDGEFSTNMYYWEGQTAAGAIYQAPFRTSGPDAIAAGSSVTIVLEFELPPADRLTQLRYEVEWDGVATAKIAVPRYD